VRLGVVDWLMQTQLSGHGEQYVERVSKPRRRPGGDMLNQPSGGSRDARRPTALAAPDAQRVPPAHAGSVSAR